MKNPPNDYKIMKEVAINLASLGIPLSFYAGYLFGSGQWQAGLLILLVYFVLDNISGRLWFRVLEKMQGRKQ